MDFLQKRRMLIARAGALITAMYALLSARLRVLQSQRPQISYGPMSIRDEERQRNLNLMYNYNDIECVNMLRMRRKPFFSLSNLLRDRKLLADNINSCVEEQVAMFLHIVGHNQRFRVVKNNWRRSIETVHRHFKDVLYAIGELRKEMIRPPSNETPVKISSCHRWYPYWKECVGAIDETHVFAKVPLKMQAAFRGRKNAPTQNVLAAVSFDLKFVYVLAGWEGSAHDATILADALQRSDGLRVPPGKFFLVDAGYACRPGFLPPYRGTRYHLKEYGNRNYPTTPKELFNLRHSSLRVSVERAFGCLKNRFRIIDTNAKLEERLRQLAAEGQAWLGVGRSHEAVAAGLRATLDQLLQQPAGGDDGCGEAEDAQSCCFEMSPSGLLADDAQSCRGSPSPPCKSCGGGDACVLLLPCRHLCLCRACEAAAKVCPICAAAKNASLQVLHVPKGILAGPSPFAISVVTRIKCMQWSQEAKEHTHWRKLMICA